MNYKDITYIVPLRCESSDRIRNLYLSLMWIKRKYNSLVIVKENNTLPLAKNVCDSFDNVIYVFEKSEDPIFHRTRLLNDMIDMCDTKYISNFDCDVILPTENVNNAITKLENGFDFVYPYGFGYCQKRIHSSDWEKFEKYLNLNSLVTDIWSSQYGHCFIAKTDSYKQAFGENEEFLSYGPEDYERFFRFKKLGYNVCHLSNEYFVYHIEHSRTQNSWSTNPHFQNNEKLSKHLEILSIEETIDYYKSLPYISKRKWKTCTA